MNRENFFYVGYKLLIGQFITPFCTTNRPLTVPTTSLGTPMDQMETTRSLKLTDI